MCKFLAIKRVRTPVSGNVSGFSIERTFNVHDDVDIEDMYGILKDHDHESTGTSIDVQCHEDDERWFTSEYLRMPSVYHFPEMIDFAKDIVAYCRQFHIPCWLKLKMW